MTSQELLDYYLELPRSKRREHFGGTARAARLAGVSQRTIQLWIGADNVQAVWIGHRYRVYLDSLKDYLREQPRTTPNSP